MIKQIAFPAFRVPTNANIKRLYLFLNIYLLFLVAWKALLWYDLPLPNGDAVWVLSQTFSLLRGDLLSSPFGQPNFTPYQFPYMYAVISAPFYALIPTEKYSVFIVNIIFWLILIFSVYYLFRRSKVTFSTTALTISALLTNTYFLNGRTELVSSILLVGIVYVLWNQEPPIPFLTQLVVATLAGMCGLIHPVHGVFAVLFVLVIAHQKRLGFRFIVYFCVLLGFVVVLAYGPVILVNVENWFDSYTEFLEREPRSMQIGHLAKFISLSPTIFVVYSLGMILTRWPDRPAPNWQGLILNELLPFALMVILLLQFGRSYYLPLLVPFIVWRLLAMPRFHIPPLLLVPLMLATPMLSHYLPTIQQLENREYVDTFNEAFAIADSYSSVAEEHHVWASAQLGMAVIDEENSRFFTPITAPPDGITLEPGDVILFMEPGEPSNFTINSDLPEDQFQIRELIPPTRGLLTIDSLFRERTSEIGLWEISVGAPPISAGMEESGR
jgi:hypothetical protein